MNLSPNIRSYRRIVGYAARMASLDAYTLFCFYHLGFDSDYEYGFRNLHHVATHFDLSADEAKAQLHSLELDASQVKHVDYNLAKAHSDAQILDLEGASMREREAFSRRIWDEFCAAKKEGISDTMIHHLEIESVFDLEEPGEH